MTCLVAIGAIALPPAVHAQETATVSGRITVMEKDDKIAQDVATSVVWLLGPASAGVTPDTFEIITADKQFRPNVVVVPKGSTVMFPNSDPFNHNVFSQSREAPFDLGLYGRRESRSTTFNRIGLIRVYCNVHPGMTALVVVRDNPFYTQAAGDGSFVMRNVPPGTYTLVAWHARAAEHSQEIDVSADGINVVDIELDASRYRFVQHRNKYDRPYSRRGRRY